MKNIFPSFYRRFKSLKHKIADLSSLRKMVDLPFENDISERQWFVLESQLSSMQERLLSKLKKVTRTYTTQIHRLHAVRILNESYGEIELEMARAFTFFDTYMDILTQRHTPELGPILGGCDVLAWDALKKDHLALETVEQPLVYVDRGFGASTLREGVIFPNGTPNPMPLIQIPYTKLKEKYNLTSILHEVGHEAIIRLGLDSILPKIFRDTLNSAAASDKIIHLYSLWSNEIGPDFWAFCGSGLAQAAGIREILALPSRNVFRISFTDPHPAPYIRVLLSFEWCRNVWGKGIWDSWEDEWESLYPINNSSFNTQKILTEAKKYLPLISKILLEKKFKELNERAIPELFRLFELAPENLSKVASTVDSGYLSLKGISPCGQLAVFRWIRENRKISEERLDKIMQHWLNQLALLRNI